MRTTIDINKSLLAQACKFSEIKTMTGLVNLALEEFIRKKRVSRMKNYFGSRVVRQTFREIHKQREHDRF